MCVREVTFLLRKVLKSEVHFEERKKLNVAYSEQGNYA